MELVSWIAFGESDKSSIQIGCSEFYTSDSEKKLSFQHKIAFLKNSVMEDAVCTCNVQR